MLQLTNATSITSGNNLEYQRQNIIHSTIQIYHSMFRLTF